MSTMPVRVAVTTVVQNSTFSGGINTTALMLHHLLRDVGCEVVLLNNTNESWFQDNARLRNEFTVVHANDVLSGKVQRFDIVMECSWNMSGDARKMVADRCVVILRKPPIMYDIESSVCPIRIGNDRGDNVHAIWVTGVSDHNDLAYLRVLYPGIQVEALPVFWYPFIVDGYMTNFNNENLRLPEWPGFAGQPGHSAEWDIHILESNSSVMSHCLIPLSVCSDLQAAASRGAAFPFTWKAHCTDNLKKKEYFTSNVCNSLFSGDLSKNFVPRQALPILCLSRSCVLAHQRFNTYRPMYLDTLWCGIPLVHNSPLIESGGIHGGYSYPGNHVGGAVDAIIRMNADLHDHKGFFATGAANERKAWIRNTWIPTGNQRILNAYKDALGRIAPVSVPVPVARPTWASAVQWEANTPGLDLVHVQRLIDVYPEEIAGRLHCCGVTASAQVSDDVVALLGASRTTPLRQCRFALATDGEGVVRAKAIGCVPVFCGPQHELDGLNLTAIVSGGVWLQAAEAVHAADSSRRNWIALAIRPLINSALPPTPSPILPVTPSPTLPAVPAVVDTSSVLHTKADERNPSSYGKQPFQVEEGGCGLYTVALPRMAETSGRF